MVSPEECSRRHGRRFSRMAARTTIVRAYASGAATFFHRGYNFANVPATASSAVCQSPHVTYASARNRSK
ncbi:MAG: hypothetical protein QOH97_1737 [Actinoplanes sp.]|nr:hypothetical protein [Actinoplanes sp.]